MTCFFGKKSSRNRVSRCLMHTTVIRSRNQLKVRDAVISADAIDMMDVLLRQERTSKVLFHDPAMLQYQPAFAGMPVKISILPKIRVPTAPQWMPGTTHASILTFLRAIVGFRSLRDVWLSVESYTTDRTCDVVGIVFCCARAFHGAIVMRVSSDLFSREWLAAFLARQMELKGRTVILAGHRSISFGVRPRLYQQRVANLFPRYYNILRRFFSGVLI